MTDPHLWLEEVEGERALAWARMQNERTLAELQADPRFERFQADARRILESRDRIADPVLMAGTVYNFWQDDQHVRGLLRRSDWASYRSGAPKWETVLDIDALSAQDGKPWVTGMPDCLEPGLPALPRHAFERRQGRRDRARVRSARQAVRRRRLCAARGEAQAGLGDR